MKLSFLSYLGLALAAKECGSKGARIWLEDFPADCEVFVGELMVQKTSARHSVELALREVKGILTVFTDFPESLKTKPLKVDVLYVFEHEAYSKDNFIKLTVNNLILNNVQTPSLRFNTAPKKFIVSRSSIKTIEGVSGLNFRKFEIHHSAGLKNFQFPEATNLYHVIFNNPGDLNIKQVLPNMVEASTVEILNSKITQLEIPGKRIVQKIIVSDNPNLVSISLPEMKTVGGRIEVRDNNQLKSVSAPKLRNANIDIKDHLETLDVPKDLTWSDKSYFDVKSFCENYSFKGLNYDTKQSCHQPGDTIKLSSTVRETKETSIKNLIIEGNFDVAAESLTTITGDLTIKDFTGALKFSLLTEIKGTLEFQGKTAIKEDAFPVLINLKNLRFKDNSGITKLTFPQLSLSDTLEILGSDITSLDGINSNAGKRVSISNAPNLCTPPINNLATIPSLVINGTFCQDLTKLFPSLDAVTKDLEISNYGFDFINIPFPTIGGDLHLKDNSVLQRVFIPKLTALSGEIVILNSPKLEFIRSPRINLKFSPMDPPKASPQSNNLASPPPPPSVNVKVEPNIITSPKDDMVMKATPSRIGPFFILIIPIMACLAFIIYMWFK